MEGVDAETFHILRSLYEAGHESVENHGHNGEGDKQRYQGALHVGVAPFAVVDHQHYGGDAQEVEQMDGYGDAYHVGYQYQVFVAVGHVGAVLPFEDEPEHQGGTERREGVDLALYGREPEGVAPRKHHGAAETGGEYHHHFQRAHRRGVVTHREALHQMGYGPEEQQDGAGAQQSRHGVDHQGHFCGVAECEVGEEAGGEHEDRVARRVADFEFKSLENEFRAVPEACRGFEGEHIANCRNQEAKPAQRVVDKVIPFHLRILTGCRCRLAGTSGGRATAQA